MSLLVRVLPEWEWPRLQSGIRLATMEDVPRIVAMGVEFLNGSSYQSVFLENADQIRALAERIIGSEDGDVLLSVNASGSVVGMIAMIAFDHFISGQRAAGEVVYWVEPRERGSSGVRLLKAAEQWAKAHGAVFIQMIAPTPRTEMLYERLGYAPIERIFQRAL